MKPYRKTDQEYYDDYDRYTIKHLKEVEEKEKKEYPKTIEFDGKPKIIYEPLISEFREDGIRMARRRESYVREQIMADENKDRLVRNHTEPQGIKCNTCGTRMFVAGHAFDYKGYKLLFLFDCPKGTHKSRRIIHPEGDEIFIPRSTCNSCGGEISTVSKKKKFLTSITDTCKSCGKKEVMEFDMTPDPPITEEDRQKYCKQFVGSRTFMEDLEAITSLVDIIDKQEAEKAEKEKYDVDKIENLTIPKLKERLIEVCQKAGFIELGFDKPNMGRQVVIEFNVQDPKDRKDRESEKALTKAFDEALFTSNWRLQKNSVSYRMGYLTGKLKGCEDPGGLLQLAKEIKEKASKKTK